MAAKVPLWVKVGQDTVHTSAGVPIHARKITAYFGPGNSANDIDTADTWTHGIMNVIGDAVSSVSGGGAVLAVSSAGGTSTFVSLGVSTNQEVIYTIWSPQ